MVGTLHGVDTTGDTRLMWDSDKPAEVEAAREMFNKLKGKGYAAYKAIGKDGAKGEFIKNFDPEVERIIMLPQMVGG